MPEAGTLILTGTHPDHDATTNPLNFEEVLADKAAIRVRVGELLATGLWGTNHLSLRQVTYQVLSVASMITYP